MRIINFADAIQEATDEAMTEDERIHVFGLGAVYPNGLDGTMGDLARRFPERVHDMPCSENAITGIGVGAAISGLHPIIHHGRLEFALHAMDQIVTQAGKWDYMFGGNYPCTLTIRIALGRQWGNGPQHTLTDKTMFSHPGLKVVCPSQPQSAKSLLLAALQEDPGPVIYLEPRWLYKLRGVVSGVRMPLNKAQILRSGDHITFVAVGDAVLEALRAAELLRMSGVIAEVIDLVSVYPLDMETIRMSVNKTRHLVAVDIATEHNIMDNVIGSLISYCSFSALDIRKVNCPDTPCPTALGLTEVYYPSAIAIANVAAEMLQTDTCSRDVRTFSEIHLPPTENISELIQ